jgi:hypothetical protein
MDFSYSATGTIRVGGCSSYKWAENVIHLYEIGDVLYSKSKASRGFFEKVVIKNAIFPKHEIQNQRKKLCKYCNLNPVYMDTLNSLWNEEDLIPFSQANSLVLETKIEKAAAIENLAFQC